MTRRDGRPPRYGTLAVARRELRFWGRSRGDRFLLLWLPLLIGGLVWWIFSAGQPRELPLVIVDEDASQFSRSAGRLMDAMPGVRVVARLEQRQAAQPWLEARRAYGVLWIPAGTSAELARGQQATLVLEHNAQFLTHASQVVREVQAAVAALSVAGVTQRLARGPQPAAAPATAQPIRVHRDTLDDRGPDYEVFLAATLLPAVLQILVMVAGVSAVGRELRDGTAVSWRHRAGGSLTAALVGKLLPYLLLYLALGALFILVFAGLRGSPIRGSVMVVLLGMALLVIASLAFGVLLVAATRNMRMGLSLAGFLAAPAFAYSGQAFPLVAMPAFAQAWASLLPLTYWLELYNRIWLAASPIALAWEPLAILALMGALPLGIGAWLLARRGFLPEAWGSR
ncbi:ABC transporter permease [Halomonas sp. H5]|uniref:ABC transporter permease n=1 Tax=Halomonas sp. H5 TaxID=3423910 RepID=UPI003D35C189